MLELADQEFISIRNELTAYENNVPERIEATPQLVGIDKASLTAFLSKSELVKQLDSKIATLTGATLRFDEEPMANHVLRLKFFKIETISELERSLREQSALLLAFADKWLPGHKVGTLHAGISVFYLGYALIAQTEDPTRIAEYLASVKLGRTGIERLVQRITKTYESLRKQE